MRILLRAAAITALAAMYLSADVTYTKSIKYTGGSMLAFLRDLVSNPLIQRMVGADLEAALEDQSYTVYVKGSKMAQVTDSGSTIYDLDAGSVTIVDSDKHTYTVETFSDLHNQIDRAEQWIKHPKGQAVPFEVHIEKTDQTRTFGGRIARKNLITLTAQSGNAWGQPVVNITSWLAPVDATTRPLEEFTQRAAQKVSSVFTLIPSFFGAAADTPAGETPAGPKPDTQKLRGISMLDQIAVTGVTTPLAGLLGNRDDHANTPVITLEIRSSNFLNAPVDNSRFAVPAGYTQERLSSRPSN